jgi:O-antigen/teichoic acid export membrane protein
MVLLALSSPILLPALFGEQWEPSVVPSQVLAIVSIFVLGAMLDHGLFYGTGRPGLWLVYAAAIDALTIVSALLTAWHGLVIWSLGFLCVAIVATFVRWPLVGRVLEARWYAAAGVFLRAMSTALFTAGFGVFASWISRELNPVVSLVLMGVAVALGQIGGMSLFMRQELKDGTQLLTSRFARWRALRNRGAPENSPSESTDVAA